MILMQCCKNGCFKQSTWSMGNAISACDADKAELQEKLKGWHIHSKCDKCGTEFHTDKLCENKEDHEFLCIVCHPSLLKKMMS